MEHNIIEENSNEMGIQKHEFVFILYFFFMSSYLLYFHSFVYCLMLQTQMKRIVENIHQQQDHIVVHK